MNGQGHGMKVKDKFRDWNLYHKSIVIGIAAVILWIMVWAVRVYDGAFEFEREETLPYSAATIWPWLIADENRPRWSAELVDVGRLVGTAGELDTTRLLFWRQGYKRWQSVERVTMVLPERIIKTAQESDKDLRWTTVELVPVGACETRVVLKETIRPIEYNDRFWFFRRSEEHEARQSESHRALKSWLNEETRNCAGENP